MKKLSTIKTIVAGAAVGAGVTTDIFIIFKLFGDVTDVSFGITCVYVSSILGLIIHVLGYSRSKKEETD